MAGKLKRVWPLELTGVISMALRPESLETPGLDNVGSATSHNPIGLHGLLQGWLLLYLYSVSVQRFSAHLYVGSSESAQRT
jgi:hypothetical protein